MLQDGKYKNKRTLRTNLEVNKEEFERHFKLPGAPIFDKWKKLLGQEDYIAYEGKPIDLNINETDSIRTLYKKSNQKRLKAVFLKLHNKMIIMLLSIISLQLY
ncbi:hypothetical protein ACDX78_07925 [Virgibacillus oceani]